ncbi:TPA: hypothetical protein HNC36_28310 [Escherichia coli]|nr:hypothetical protein [Escherichia coli]
MKELLCAVGVVPTRVYPKSGRFNCWVRSFCFKLCRVMLGFSAHYWLLLMPFYFRKECPLNSGYLN